MEPGNVTDLFKKSFDGYDIINATTQLYIKKAGPFLLLHLQ